MYGEALAAFDGAVRMDGGPASAHAGRGLALEALGRHAEALAAYGTAVLLDPGSASAHAGRGLALEALGRHAEALAAYGTAIGIDGDHEAARAGAGRLGRRRPSGGASDGGTTPGGRAMDPDYGSARGYIEYCLSRAPHAGGSMRDPRVGGRRSPPLTAEEAADIRESAASGAVVTMEGSAFVELLDGWIGNAERGGR